MRSARPSTSYPEVLDFALLRKVMQQINIAFLIPIPLVHSTISNETSSSLAYLHHHQSATSTCTGVQDTRAA
jgi:hypothetical protein